ncbi:MAG: hypothetical protein M3300_00850 [Actinomycetota bacterium]|nr:hypothetical protein [Actinomycetota bacterium]
MTSGEYSCLAFTHLTQFVAVLGEFQPWVGLSREVLEREMARAGLHVLHIDSHLPAEAWRWQRTPTAAFQGSTV